MPASDIVNRNAQFILGMGQGVRTIIIFKIILFPVIGVYASNDFELSITFSPSYKVLEGKNRGGFGGSIRDILIEDGLFVDEHSYRTDISMLNQNGINISVDPTVTDPFFHT